MEHKRQQGVRFQTAFRRRDVPQWGYNTIARILKNEVYLGNLTQGKRGTPNHKVHDIRLKDEADWIHAEATHEALISSNDFMVVSELLKRICGLRMTADNIICFPDSFTAGIVSRVWLEKL